MFSAKGERSDCAADPPSYRIPVFNLCGVIRTHTVSRKSACGTARLRPRAAAGNPDVRMTTGIAVHLIAIGLVVRAVSGFFGIGGGFLIVRGLMLATGMPILNAIGSSPFSVGSFGLTTAINHTLSGLIERAIALLFIPGGVAGATVARA